MHRVLCLIEVFKYILVIVISLQAKADFSKINSISIRLCFEIFHIRASEQCNPYYKKIYIYKVYTHNIATEHEN